MKYVIDELVQVPGPLRELYRPTADGKFTLDLDGHPDAAKLKEFRDRNIALMKEVDELRPLKAKFDGLDLEAVETNRLKLLELEKATPDARVAELQAELASEKTARTTAQAKADRGVLRDALRSKLLAAGVLPGALDIALDKAEPSFTVENDVVMAKPGAVLDVDDWIAGASTTLPFLFAKSSGSGSAPAPHVLGARTNARELRDPTPQQLGEHAAAISSGRVRIVYSE